MGSEVLSRFMDIVAGYMDYRVCGVVPVLSEAVFTVPDQNQWLGSCPVEGEGGSNAVIFMCAELSVHHVLVLVEFSLLAVG